MSYDGPERRILNRELRERIAVLENEISIVKETLQVNTKILQELRDNNIRLKTIIGAASFVISGIWIIVLTFKDNFLKVFGK